MIILKKGFKAFIVGFGFFFFVLFLAIFLGGLSRKTIEGPEPTNFEECILFPGSFIDPSHPNECRTGSGGKFTRVSPKCTVSGCSGQLCIDGNKESGVTDCVFRAEYVCYKQASCVEQKNGQCGWEETEELTACLNKEKPTVKPSGSGNDNFCGGIAGIICPLGYACKYDGNYPDSGGKCVKISK